MATYKNISNRLNVYEVYPTLYFAEKNIHIVKLDIFMREKSIK